MAARVAQNAVEVLALEPSGAARLAQVATEVVSAPLPGRTRTAQIAVAVLHALGAFVPSGGTTGAWFKVLEGDNYTGRDLID